jgi:hypothetical protein
VGGAGMTPPPTLAASEPSSVARVRTPPRARAYGPRLGPPREDRRPGRIETGTPLSAGNPFEWPHAKPMNLCTNPKRKES